MANREILVFNGSRVMQQPCGDTLVLCGPLNTVTYIITATGALTLTPGGDAGIQADNTRNDRGDFAIDLQLSATANTQVASGSSSMILGGARNTANGIRSMVVGGEDNTSSGQASVILSGDQNEIEANASYSAILGGRLNDIIESDYSIICCGDTNNINVSDSCFIGGGVGHLIETGATGAFIGGGSNNDILGTALVGVCCGGQNASVGGSRAGTVAGRYASAQGSYAFVGAGLSCTVTSAGVYGCIVGGRNNTVTADYGCVVGGYFNDATGDYSGALSGYNSNAEGAYSVVAGGSNGTASGSYSCVPGGSRCVASSDYGFACGYRAVATFSGAMAHSGAYVARTGDSQAQVVQMQGSTADATAKLLYTNGVDEKLVMTANTCWAFRCLGQGFNFDTEAESVAYEISGLCRRTGTGNIAFVGTPTSVLLGRDNASHSITATVNTTTQSLDFVIQGTAATNIKWAARVELVHLDNL